MVVVEYLKNSAKQEGTKNLTPNHLLGGTWMQRSNGFTCKVMWGRGCQVNPEQRVPLETEDRKKKDARSKHYVPCSLCLAVDLEPSAPGAADKSMPVTGCGARAAMPTTWHASPAFPASASYPPARNSAWLRRRCFAASITTP